MSKTKPLLETLKGNHSGNVPFWFMRQAGRYLSEYMEVRSGFPSFLEFCYTPDAACEVTLQPIDRFGMDAAILFSDILVIPDALGQDVSFVKGEGPKLKALEGEADIKVLNQDKVLDHLSPVFEAVSKIRKALPEDKTLIGFAGSPWTVACYMIEGQGSKDFAKVRELAYRNPALFQNLMDILVESTSEYVIQQIQSGADVIQLFDSWANLLPKAEFEKWVIQPTKRIVDKIKAHSPETPVIGFARGAALNLPDYAKQTGVQGLGIDQFLSIDWARDALSDNYVLQGNLDPVLVASNGEKAVEETKRILQTMKGKPFIFNLGHGFLPHTPVENVQAVSDTVKAFA